MQNETANVIFYQNAELVVIKHTTATTIWMAGTNYIPEFY